MGAGAAIRSGFFGVSGFGAKDFGAPLYIGIAFFVLLCIILISRYGNGLLSNISVLLGIAAGFIDLIRVISRDTDK